MVDVGECPGLWLWRHAMTLSRGGVGSSVVPDGQPLIAHMTTHSACGNATRVMACFGPYSVWLTGSHRWPLADR